LQRLERARGERLSVRRMKERGQAPSKSTRSKAAPERVAKAKQVEATVLRGYRAMVRTLASSEDAGDRKLAVGASASGLARNYMTLGATNQKTSSGERTISSISLISGMRPTAEVFVGPKQTHTKKIADT